MKEAMRRAIEGGYMKESQWDLTSVGDDTVHFKEYDGDGFFKRHKHISTILLDPLFWQALGKMERWKKTGYCYGCGYDEGCTFEGWENQWHRFIDHLIEGKDIDSFFTNLLK